jgi:hypothetical protein
MVGGMGQEWGCPQVGQVARRASCYNSPAPSKGREAGKVPDALRLLTTLLRVSALLGIAVMLLSDVVHHLRPSPVHTHSGAFALLVIGLSYISLQLSARRPRSELVKGLALGAAFVLWGSEQLLPLSFVVTLMDSMVITIFVVDLSFIIGEHLKLKDHELP